MKALAHIPTEQYGFIEQELEGSTNEEIKMAYNAIKRAWEAQEGLTTKDFNAFLDNMLLKEDFNHVETYEAMNDQQRAVVQEIKKCLKRIKEK